MSQTGGLVKKVRGEHQRILAANLKPPEKRQLGGTPDEPIYEYYVRYVTQQGKELRLPCSEEVFARVFGRRSDRRAHTGLDMQVYSHFILSYDNKEKKVTGVDVYPNRPVMHNLPRADAPEHGNLVMAINAQSGDMTIEDYPDDVNEGHMISLLNAVNKAGEISVGQDFAGFEVSSIAGGRVYFNIDNLPDAAEAIDEEAIFTVNSSPERVGTGGRGLAPGMGGIGYVTPSGGGTGGEIHPGGGR